MKKRIFALLLVLCLALTLLPGAAFAADESGECGADGDSVTWSHTPNTLTISGTGKMRNFSSGDVPWHFWEDITVKIIIEPGVTYIGDYAFSGMRIGSISIPDSVTAIGNRAFYRCDWDLEEGLKLPDSITTIGDYAFVGTSLRSITLPSGLTTMGKSAFSISTLTNVIIPEGITTISDAAFSNCSMLTELSLPDSITTIGDQAFSNCSGLTTVNLPANCTTLALTAFRKCTALEEIRVSAENPVYTSVGGVLFSKDKTTLLRYPAGLAGDYTVPDGVTAISENAFSDCHSLTGVILPDSVITMGDGAFKDCDQLQSIILSGSLTSISYSAFYDCSQLTAVVIPDGVTEIGDSAFSGCFALARIALPDTVTKIGNSAFLGCHNLARVHIPSGVTEIGESAFWGCGVKALVIPEGVTTLGEGTFSRTTNMKQVYLPASLTSLHYTAFYCGQTETHPVSDIYFGGTRAQWEALTDYEIYNWIPADVTMHYNSKPTDVSDTGFRDAPKATNWAYPGISYCIDRGLMAGMTDTTFEPNGTLTRGQLVAILWRQAGEPTPTHASPFTDLTMNYYRNAIAWAAEHGIVAGRDATHFDPNSPITRQELTAIFHRYVGEYLELDVSGAADITGFPDYNQVSNFAKGAMAWAKGVALISGDKRVDGIYLDPRGNATRAQAATMFMNLCENVLQ